MRVLLADDDTRVGQHVRQALTAEGYAVDYAQDGDEAPPLVGGEQQLRRYHTGCDDAPTRRLYDSTVAHQSLFQSGWFVEGLLSQTLIVHMIRTQKIPFLQSVATGPVLILTDTIMFLGLVIPFTWFGASIGLQPLPTAHFLCLGPTLLSYCLAVQLVKLWYLRKFRAWL
jgi:magnesium-transporting ATPase (P-type)